MSNPKDLSMWKKFFGLELSLSDVWTYNTNEYLEFLSGVADLPSWVQDLGMKRHHIAIIFFVLDDGWGKDEFFYGALANKLEERHKEPWLTRRDIEALASKEYFEIMDWLSCLPGLNKLFGEFKKQRDARYYGEEFVKRNISSYEFMGRKMGLNHPYEDPLYTKKKHSPKKGKAGYVYVVECAGRYKIGRTKDFNQRFQTLRTSAPYALTLVSLIETENSRKLENQIHRDLGKSRVRLEWFELSQEQIDWLISMDTRRTKNEN